MTKRQIGLIFAAFIISMPAQAQQGWSRYCNERFGQCADIPQALQADPPPVNGDGRKFSGFGNDDFELSISASFNVLRKSVASAMKDAVAAENTQITYQRKGPNWFVISGYDGDTLFYTKIYVTRAHLSTLSIRHAAAATDRYRTVVTRISKSFTPASE